MKLEETQRLQSVVRALIFGQDHLLLTRWRDSYAFCIGGRVEHGEPLHKAVQRELCEETGLQGRIAKLLYFDENFFYQNHLAWHEYGWYFLMEAEGSLPSLDQVLPNPDHPDLSIQWVPIADLPQTEIYPRFLRRFLLADFQNGFRDNPRHILSNELVEPPQIRPLPF